MSTRPNILVILTDQQAATMMGCAGNPYVRTPHMDWIAAGGVRFEKAFCCNPVCIPSRFSLLTGKYPSAIGVRNNDIPNESRESAKTCYRTGMGWLMQEAGYDAVYAGKEHLPHGVADDLGFHVLTRDDREPTAHACADYLNMKHDRPFLAVASLINPHDICYMAIRDAAQSNPHHAGCINLEQSHHELRCLDEALALPAGMDEATFFATCCPPLPDNHHPQMDEPEGISFLLNQRGFRRHAREQYSQERWRMHRWAYARLTERVDREIGIILDALRSSGHDRDTIILFTSDHGDHDAAHGLEHKTIPYQEATRIPMLLRPAGGLSEGKVNTTHLVSNGLDLLPTVCDYAGAAIPADIEGRSLRTFTQKTAPTDWREELLIESENALSVLTVHGQLTQFDHGKNHEQFYDLARDPGQTRNHMNDPVCREQLEHHRRLLAIKRNMHNKRMALIEMKNV